MDDKNLGKIAKDSSKSETHLRKINDNLKKLRDDNLKEEAAQSDPLVRTERPTGENIKAPGLRRAGRAASIAGTAVVIRAPTPQAKAVGGAVALGGQALLFAADEIEQMEKLDIKVRTLNEAMERFRDNRKKIQGFASAANAGPVDSDDRIVTDDKLREERDVALTENQAIIDGLAATWERLAGQLGRMKKFGGKLADPAVADKMVSDITAVRDALVQILAVTNDPELARVLRRLRGFLARTAPSGTFFGEGGEPRAGGSILPGGEFGGQLLPIPQRKPFNFPPIPERKPSFPDDTLPGKFESSAVSGGLGLDEFNAQLDALGPRLSVFEDGLLRAAGQAEALGTALENALTKAGVESNTERASLRERQFASLSDGGFSDVGDSFFDRARLLPEAGTPIQDRLDAIQDEERSITSLTGAYSGLNQEKGQTIVADEQIVKGQDLIDQAASRAGASLSSALERAIFEGRSLSDTLKDLARDLSRIGFDVFVRSQIEGFVGPSGGGILGGIFGSSTLGTRADAIIAANPGIFHGGGVAGRET